MVERFADFLVVGDGVLESGVVISGEVAVSLSNVWIWLKWLKKNKGRNTKQVCDE